MSHQARNATPTIAPIRVPGFVHRLIGMMTDMSWRSRYASHATNAPRIMRETTNSAGTHGVAHPLGTIVDSLSNTDACNQHQPDRTQTWASDSRENERQEADADDAEAEAEAAVPMSYVLDFGYGVVPSF